MVVVVLEFLAEERIKSFLNPTNEPTNVDIATSWQQNPWQVSSERRNTGTYPKPKPWILLQIECKISSIHSCLILTSHRFLMDGTKWAKKSKADPLRGFEHDGEPSPIGRRRTAQQKVSMLELILGQIANYCPAISRSTLIKYATSIDSIWHAIRLYFGFQVQESTFYWLCWYLIGAYRMPRRSLPGVNG